MAATPDGVNWPVTSEGKVSTTATAKTVWVACCEAMAQAEGSTPEFRQACVELQGAIEAEANWRYQYHVLLGRLAALAASSPAAAVAQACAGLEALHAAFTFDRAGKSQSLLTAALDRELAGAAPPKTVTIKGTGERAVEFTVPVNRASFGRMVESVLTGERIAAQASSWAEYGCCESSVMQSVASLVEQGPAAAHKTIDGRVFCLLGGTSELGPVRTLLQHGATVAALARPGRKIAALADLARTSAGTLLLPQLADSDAAPAEAGAAADESDLVAGTGIDLLLQAPEAVSWLASVAHAYPHRQLVVGSYVYLDGELHVRASLAMDAVVEGLRQRVGAARIELAFLGSPTTQHLWPDEARAAAQRRWDNRSWYARVAGCESNAQVSAVPAFAGGRTVFNGAMTLQGPNYALAKTLQMWRCVVARESGVSAVSFNYAPPARTESVTHAPQLASALDGMQNFEPLVVLEPRTASAFMALLLLHDLSVASPPTPEQHPWDMFVTNAFHGGNWRCAYTLNSTATATYLAGQLRPKREMVGLVPSRV